MKYSPILGRALILCAATALPSASLAGNEPGPTQPALPMQIVCPKGEFATAVSPESSVCVRTVDGRILIVSVIQLEGFMVPPTQAGEFLDRGRMSSSIDDFGGPFGWKGLPLVDPRPCLTGAVDTASGVEENCK